MPSKSVAWIQDNGHRPGSVHLVPQVVHSSSWGKHAFRRISTLSLLWDHADQRRRPDLRHLGERSSHGISCQAKLRLPVQHLTVLCGNLPACGSSHGQTRSK